MFRTRVDTDTTERERDGGWGSIEYHRALQGRRGWISGNFIVIQTKSSNHQGLCTKVINDDWSLTHWSFPNFWLLHLFSTLKLSFSRSWFNKNIQTVLHSRHDNHFSCSYKPSGTFIYTPAIHCQRNKTESSSNDCIVHFEKQPDFAWLYRFTFPHIKRFGTLKWS